MPTMWNVCRRILVILCGARRSRLAGDPAALEARRRIRFLDVSSRRFRMLADGESPLAEPATDWWRLPISIFGLMVSHDAGTPATIIFGWAGESAGGCLRRCCCCFASIFASAGHNFCSSWFDSQSSWTHCWQERLVEVQGRFCRTFAVVF